MWGWWDANIWITNAGIYKPDKTPKQAAVAIQQLWDKEFSTSLELASPSVDGSGWLEFTGFYGTYVFEYVAADGQAIRGTLQLGRQSPRQSLVDATQ